VPVLVGYSVAYLLLVVGGCCCCINFYLSFLRYPLYKLLRKEYRWESGLPVFGSLFVAIATALLWHQTRIAWLGSFLIAIDTGGLHGFSAP
jgi:hypothetical protein